MAQPKVFVSHSHMDDAFAERLVNDLRAAGADAWLDKEDILAGNFQQRISEALGTCEWFVLVLTRNALASPWVQQEVDAANRLKHQGRIHDLIFIQSEGVENRELPALWGVYHVLDATTEYSTALDRTLEAIRLPSLNSPSRFISPANPPADIDIGVLPQTAPPAEEKRGNLDLLRSYLLVLIVAIVFWLLVFGFYRWMMAGFPLP